MALYLEPGDLEEVTISKKKTIFTISTSKKIGIQLSMDITLVGTGELSESHMRDFEDKHITGRITSISDYSVSFQARFLPHKV